MNHGSLFSGIGGFDLAAEWMGWNNVFHCEINPFGQKVLKYYWPNAISYDDITKTDFTIHRGQIDILTGGFPCQPFSLAGKRKGTEDPRNLWPEYYRAIKEIQPTWVVGENVPGLINWSNGLVFEQVQADLEAEGYEVWPFILPACSVGAPHKRERVWFVAYRSGERLERCTGASIQRGVHGLTGLFKIRATTNSSSYGLHDEPTTGNNTNWTNNIESGAQRISTIEGLSNEWTFTNTSNEGLQRCQNERSIKESREKRNEQPAGLFQPEWEQFPTQSPICIGNDGISSRLAGITFPKHRNESIKAYGNAIVPQVVYQIFKSIEEFIK